MNAIQCACGLRIESDDPLLIESIKHLELQGHDMLECSRQQGYEQRLIGAQRMVEIAIEHLRDRESLSGAEIAEIHTVLSNRVMKVLQR